MISPLCTQIIGNAMSDFTKLLQKNERVVVANLHAFALLTYTPITPGHTLVIPKREVATFTELSEEELRDIAELTREIMARLRVALGAEGFNCAWNEGSDFGQSVPHFHLHIVPRVHGDGGIDEYDPRRVLYRPGKRAVQPTHDLEEMAAMLREVQQ